jgi:hypothetical protein
VVGRVFRRRASPRRQLLRGRTRARVDDPTTIPGASRFHERRQPIRRLARACAPRTAAGRHRVLARAQRLAADLRRDDSGLRIGRSRGARRKNFDRPSAAACSNRSPLERSATESALQRLPVGTHSRVDSILRNARIRQLADRRAAVDCAAADCVLSNVRRRALFVGRCSGRIDRSGGRVCGGELEATANPKSKIQNPKLSWRALPASGTLLAHRIIGGVVEWLMAPVLKTGRAQALVGSNPTPSAEESADLTLRFCSRRPVGDVNARYAATSSLRFAQRSGYRKRARQLYMFM